MFRLPFPPAGKAGAPAPRQTSGSRGRRDGVGSAVAAAQRAVEIDRRRQLVALRRCQLELGDEARALDVENIEKARLPFLIAVARDRCRGGERGALLGESRTPVAPSTGREQRVFDVAEGPFGGRQIADHSLLLADLKK